MTFNTALLAFAIGSEISGLIESSGLVAKAVLVILLAFSLISWAIIFSKWGLFRRARAQSNRFMRMFRKSERLQDVAAVADQFRPSPLIAVFEGAYNELRKQAPQPIRLGALQRAIQVAASEELTHLESRLPWLATTGAVTPFIGLFGTVWGIMHAFRGLSNVAQATLAAVAPGIAEALVATAIGLFAAIPAVVAYNRFADQVTRLELRFDAFIEEFSTILQRHAARGTPTVAEERH